MGAKCKSKTHLLNTFFYFWHRFLRVWLQILKKYKYDLHFFHNKKGIKKLILLISNPLIKFFKNTQKVMSKKSLGKSGKSSHFRQVFAKNFFWYIFLKLFQRIFSKF
jgi:hypothetical protein